MKLLIAALLLTAVPAFARDVLVTEPLAVTYPVEAVLRLPWSRVGGTADALHITELQWHTSKTHARANEANGCA